MMPEKDLRYKLIGEPVTRPDGGVMIVWEIDQGDLYVKVSGQEYSVGRVFPRKKVLLLGGGSFNWGVDSIAQACYKTEIGELLDVEILI